MVGITSYGVYIPLWRMDRKLIGGRGEKAIAHFDEDSITMAVAAGVNCLNGVERASVDKAFFASTTFPYREKQGASIVAAACDLPHSIGTSDFANSLKGGTSALLAAVDAVRGKSAKRVIVTAADTRIGAPMEEFERITGDGAAGLVIGDTDVAVSIEASYSVSDEIMDLWRTQHDTFVRSWESRFVDSVGYQRIGAEAIAGLLQSCHMKPADFSKLVFSAPDPRSSMSLAAKLGFNPNTQLQNPLLDVLGNTGTSFPLILLAAALDESKPGDSILLLGYGDGADALLLRVTEKIESIKNRKAVKEYLNSKKMINDYPTYLLWRGLLHPDSEKVYYTKYQENTAVPAMWRERNRIFRLHGVKCRACNTIQFPPQRVCARCHNLEQFDEVRLSDKRGTVFTFSMDYTSLVDNPTVVPIVDFEGGGRGEFYLTDRDPKKVEVGMQVEMSFRKLFFDEGIYHYYWKAMPVRI
jgi:hydroxymethylglutaryl-CoA synthase